MGYKTCVYNLNMWHQKWVLRARVMGVVLTQLYWGWMIMYHGAQNNTEISILIMNYWQSFKAKVIGNLWGDTHVYEHLSRSSLTAKNKQINKKNKKKNIFGVWLKSSLFLHVNPQGQTQYIEKQFQRRPQCFLGAFDLSFTEITAHSQLDQHSIWMH